MNKIKLHRFVLLMITISVMGLTIESFLELWEFWVNPLLIVGLVCLWVLHIGQFLSERTREALYVAFGLFAALFHGVHATSFYDVCSVIILMLIIYAFFNRVYILYLIFALYLFIMTIQFLYLNKPETFIFDTITISRLLLQFTIVVTVLLVCKMSIDYRMEQEEALKKRDADIVAYDRDMEDFLTNISHELRTPVNVVNGMSMMLQSQNGAREIDAIREAGLRLSDQIEGIQDYTEIRRDSLVLENEDYMITSLINDVVTEYKRFDANDLEFVVDLLPSVPTLLKGDVRKIKKILRHLLDNAVKFTSEGGIYLRISSIKRKYGVNLCFEITDTGVGMERRDLTKVGIGMYQANKDRNRSFGGIGLGLPVVYGMAHKMGGFVKIESERGAGTIVRVTLPQGVVDRTPCLICESGEVKDILFHVMAGKYRVPAIRDFYRNMATNLATGIQRPLYSADSTREIEHLIERLDVSHIFMGEEEYLMEKEFFDKLSQGDIVVAVSARPGFTTEEGSKVIVIPKPLYGYPVVKILNGERLSEDGLIAENLEKPIFPGVRALIVDDEPMNLVVAAGMFDGKYKMQVDTVGSGREAIERCMTEEYDLIFMDHMMPEMDGVEAMKRIREEAGRTGRKAVIIALTANAVSGAREMFLKEGFDGFVAKPIDVSEFERVMRRVLPSDKIVYERRERA